MTDLHFPLVPPERNFIHRVRCDDREHWQRSRQVYWHVLAALWEHADRFRLQEHGAESVLTALARLPGVQAVPDSVSTVAGPTSDAAREILLRPGGRVWFSLALYQGGRMLFYDEDGGDTMTFVALPDTLARLAAAGVTAYDLIDLAGSNARYALQDLLLAAMLSRLGGRWGHGFSGQDPRQRFISFPDGSGHRAVLLAEEGALDALVAAPDPAAAVAALFQGIDRLREPTEALHLHPELGKLVLTALHPELCPRRRLRFTHRLDLAAGEGGLWTHLVAVAARASERILLTIPPAGPTAMHPLDVLRPYPVAPADPAWLERLLAAALAVGPSTVGPGLLFVLPAERAGELAGWSPTAGWPLALGREGRIWLEAAGRGDGPRLAAARALTADALLAPRLQAVPGRRA